MIHRLILWIAFLAGLLSLAAIASPRLEVEVGLGGQFVPENLTQLRARISGVGFPFTGSLLLTQEVGNLWRGVATSRVRIPFTQLGAELHEWAVPVYDPNHPLEVLLLGQDEEVVASATIDPHALRGDKAFCVGVGALRFPLVEDLVAVAPEDLPRLWQSYEAVRALWIGRVSSGLSQEHWEAIVRFVLAGGTLVLFTGRDFFLLDSPLLEELLPLERPRVEAGQDGLFYLRGEERPGARALFQRDGFPLVEARPYGAGTVLLVTTSALDLDETTAAALGKRLPDAHLLSTVPATATLLEGTRLERPGYLPAILLVAASLVSLSAILLYVQDPKKRALWLIATAGLLCAGSGFYTIFAKRVNHIYQLITSLSVQTSVGFETVSYGLFATESRPVALEVRGPTPLVQEIPASLEGHRYDLDVTSDQSASLFTERGERRYLHTLEVCQIPLRVRPAEQESVRIDNRLTGALEEGLLIVEGRAYALGGIPRGESVHSLRDAIPLEEAKMHGKSFAPLYATLAEEFAFQDGVWLVGASEVEREESSHGVRQKVRDVALYVVRGEKRG